MFCERPEDVGLTKGYCSGATYLLAEELMDHRGGVFFFLNLLFILVLIQFS